MLLSQNRSWRVTRGKSATHIAVSLEKEELPEDWREFKDFRLEIPHWTTFIGNSRLEITVVYPDAHAIHHRRRRGYRERHGRLSGAWGQPGRPDRPQSACRGYR